MGVGVAVNEYDIGLFRFKNRLQALEHSTGLSAVGCGAYSQMMFWSWDVQRLEEEVGHCGVVVLTGVDKDFFNPCATQRARDRGSFDELRTSADNGDDFHVPMVAGILKNRPQIAPLIGR